MGKKIFTLKFNKFPKISIFCLQYRKHRIHSVNCQSIKKKFIRIIRESWKKEIYFQIKKTFYDKNILGKKRWEFVHTFQFVVL
jgi:hypothetical protein